MRTRTSRGSLSSQSVRGMKPANVSWREHHETLMCLITHAAGLIVTAINTYTACKTQSKQHAWAH